MLFIHTQCYIKMHNVIHYYLVNKIQYINTQCYTNTHEANVNRPGP